MNATVIDTGIHTEIQARNEVDAVHTQDLSKAYDGVKVLDNLTFSVPKNSIFGFLGPNGAGKSTTIKLLLGLIQPTGGKASVFGHDITHESVAVRSRVGYLAQDPRYYEQMTARQTLRYTAHFFFSGPNKLLEDRVSEMLDLVGLADKADRPIKGFSGGERQRLGIAQAQVNYPDLLILDEPAASLDPQGRYDVLSIMERLRKHTTIFYSTHILEDVQRVSDTVAILNHGKLIAQAPIQQLLAGSSGTASYAISLQGDAQQERALIAAQPWVLDQKAAQADGVTTLEIAVSDPAAAEAHLLRTVLSVPSAVVTNFGRKTHNLEEVFLNLVERSNQNGN
ncbi:MAG: ABC transporter ATP-binding protein [Chloroflexota bacterium]